MPMLNNVEIKIEGVSFGFVSTVIFQSVKDRWCHEKISRNIRQWG